MKSSDLDKFSSLSEVDINGSELIVTSTKMSIIKNAYIKELWRYSNNTWKRFKGSESKNFLNAKYSRNKNYLSYIEVEKDKDEKPNFKLIVKEGNSLKIIFKTKANIQSYIWSKSNKHIYVIVNDWEKSFSKIQDKNDEPFYLENIPHRFDTKGVTFNRRCHIYKVNVVTGTSSKIVDGDKENLTSLGSVVEHGKYLYFSTSAYNEMGTMLQERIIKKTSEGLEIIHSKGMWSKLFSFNGKLYGVGLKNRFDWPTVTSIYEISDSGKTRKIDNNFDRTIVDIKTTENLMYVLYEDSGKQLLGIKTEKGIKNLFSEEITITDFVIDNEDLYFIANSFTRNDEVFRYTQSNIEKISKTNDAFHKKVVSYECTYKRFDTGKSKVDTWGIFVGKDRPTLLNIHGGPASQYGFTFFDEFQVYAEAGFNVIACNPRGSTGRGHKYLRDVCGNKWGVNDTHDVLSVFKQMVRELKITNKDYGIMGGSYGGFMTSWIIGAYPKMFKSAIVERALINWETMVGTSDIGIGFPEMYLLDDMDNNLNLYRKKSPITYAKKIKTPTLILHSENDYRCPIEQGEQLFSTLKRNKVDSAMIRFPNEGHELSRSGKPVHRKQRFDFIIDWHRKHLS
ncbi:S9 family peptidase [Acidimicrobiia bacterium]|nr:S9 family peptidase [Acidimicrobiia bacterium]